MFQSIPVCENNIFAYKLVGKLTKKDYQDFLPKITTLIHKYGSISLLLDLEDFHGLEAKALWEDYKFSTAHRDNFIKIAVVGDKRWQEWMTVLGNAFVKTEMKYFERDTAGLAWDWLRNYGEEAELVQDSEKDCIRSYKRILAATDFSEHSEKALKRAIELSKKYDAELTIINVLSYHHNYDSNYVITALPGQYDADDQLLYKNTKKQLCELTEELGLQDADYDVVWGTPKATILSYAKALQADLIVMGSHGRHGLSRLIGSTTNGVINHAQCEVLSVNISKN